jgi:hypothetical protein
MLSVTASALTYQTLDFSIPEGTISAIVFAGVRHSKVSGSAVVTGSITFTGPAKGKGSLTSVTGDLSTPRFDLDFAASGPIRDQAGKLTASAGRLVANWTVTEPAHQRVVFKGKLSASDMIATLGFSDVDFGTSANSGSAHNIALEGAIVQGGAPFDVQVGTTSWRTVNGKPVLTVPVMVPAGDNLATVAKDTVPAATISVFWANSNNNDSTIGKPISGDTIRIAWDEAGGTYTISNLPQAPAGADELVLETNFGGQVQHTTVVPLSGGALL